MCQPSIGVFHDLVLKDLEALAVTKPKIDKRLENGVKQLCAKKNLVILLAKKGDGIVVLAKQYYLE